MARDAPARGRDRNAVRIVGRGRWAAPRGVREGRSERTRGVVRPRADRPRDHRCARAAGGRFGICAREGEPARARCRDRDRSCGLRLRPVAREPEARRTRSTPATPSAWSMRSRAPKPRASGSMTDCRRASKKSSPPTAIAISSSRSAGKIDADIERLSGIAAVLDTIAGALSGDARRQRAVSRHRRSHRAVAPHRRGAAAARG